MMSASIRVRGCYSLFWASSGGNSTRKHAPCFSDDVWFWRFTALRRRPLLHTWIHRSGRMNGETNPIDNRLRSAVVALSQRNLAIIGCRRRRSFAWQHHHAKRQKSINRLAKRLKVRVRRSRQRTQKDSCCRSYYRHWILLYVPLE